ncbi:MAG TPA: MerR family transcriptional regulator [Candidatus Paceibacterota bacterium]
MSNYSVHQLAMLAGVTAKTLHHYDEIGLLKPAEVQRNGYRSYGEEELLRLQQILFFKELDLPLREIQDILELPSFDLKEALKEHKKLLGLKKKRLDGLIATIDRTIRRINKEKNMTDKDLYDSFGKEEIDQYADEAKARWGHTDAYKQSQERYGKLSKEEKEKIQRAGEELLASIAELMPLGADHEEVQKLIARHYDGLRTFYEPSKEMYKGLGDLYASDERFGAYFEKFAPGLAAFMQKAMHAYANSGGR